MSDRLDASGKPGMSALATVCVSFGIASALRSENAGNARHSARLLVRKVHGNQRFCLIGRAPRES